MSNLNKLKRENHYLRNRLQEVQYRLETQTQLARSLASEIDRITGASRESDCMTPWRTPCECPACAEVAA